MVRKVQGSNLGVLLSMPNHVPTIAVTGTKDGLNLANGEAHRRYTRRINFRERWHGHLWQEKFSSFILGSIGEHHAHLLTFILTSINKRVAHEFAIHDSKN
jgi:hypothetical protein